MERYNDRSASELLRGVQNDFREFCRAQVRFFEWLRNNPSAGFLATSEAFESCVRASEFYGASSTELKERFPEEAQKLHELLMPIQREFFDR